jgi:hypothetical protein
LHVFKLSSNSRIKSKIGALIEIVEVPGGKAPSEKTTFRYERDFRVASHASADVGPPEARLPIDAFGWGTGKIHACG